MKKDKNLSLNREKKDKKKFLLLLLFALGIGTTSGTSVFLGLKAMNPGSDTPVIPTPPVPTPEEETPFSLMLNRLIESKNIYIEELDVVVNPGSTTTDSAVLKFKGLQVDLSELNTSVISFSTTLNVVYGDFDQELTLAFEENTYLYIGFKGEQFRINGIHTIDDIVTALKSIGVKLPSSSGTSSASSMDINSIMEAVSSVLNSIDIQTSPDNKTFSFNLGTIESGSVKLDNLALSLSVGDTEEYKLSSLNIGSMTAPMVVSNNGEKLVSLYITTRIPEGSDAAHAISLDEHTYNKVQNGTYTDVTDANASVFTEIANIFNIDNNGIVSARSAIDLGIDLKEIQTDSEERDFMSFSGGLMIDSSNVSKLMSNARFRLDLNNNKTSNTTGDHLSDPMDTLRVYYAGGSTNAAYINLNNSIRAKVKNATSKELLDYVADADGGKKIISNIGELLGKSLDSLPIASLKDVAASGQITTSDIDAIADTVRGYAGKLNGVIDGISFRYDDSACQFIFTMDSKALGLTGDADRYDIIATVSLKRGADGKLDKVTKGIREIAIENIRVNNIKTSVRLTPKAFDDSRDHLGYFEDSECTELDFVDMEPVAGIFRTVGDFFAEKRGQMNYTFSYSGDGADNDFQAKGTIGADLRKVTSLDFMVDGKDGLEKGDYYISMDMNTGKDSLNHGVKISYQDAVGSATGKNIYFSYNEVFKNFITDAKVANIIGILNEKTSSAPATTTVTTIDSVLAGLKFNEDFIRDLKDVIENHTIKGLTSFISLSNPGGDTTKLALTLNTDKLFASDSFLSGIGALTILVDTSRVEGENPLHYLESITVSGLVASPARMNLNISFPRGLENPKIDSVEEYTEIEDIDTIVSAFYHLPTKALNSVVKIEADISRQKSNPASALNDDDPAFAIDGAVNIDKEGGYYGGKVEIIHDSLGDIGTQNKTKARQKIDFAYKTKDDEGNPITNAQFAAEYNDKMHILMRQNSLKDLINTVSDDVASSSQLTSSLDFAQNIATGLPILKAIQEKDPSILLNYQYLYKVDFNDANNTITIYIDRTLFDENAKQHDDEDAMKITIGYKEGETLKDASLDYIELSTLISKTTKTSNAGFVKEGDEVRYEDDGSFTSKTTYQKIRAKLSFGDPETFERPEVKMSDDGSGELFIDMDSENIKNLLRSGIQTTDFNYYKLSGAFVLDLTANLDEGIDWKIREFSFNLGLEMTFFIADNQVYTDLFVNNGRKAYGEKGYHATEYRLANDHVYFTKTTSDGENIEQVSYRTTEKNISQNLPYYLLSETLNFNDKIAGRTLIAQITNAMASSKNKSTTSDGEVSISSANGFKLGLKDDFSQIISSLDATKTDVGTNLYKAKFNLASIFSEDSTLIQNDLLNFGTCELSLYDQKVNYQDGSEKNPFYAIGLEINAGLIPFTKKGTTRNLLDISLKGDVRSKAGEGLLKTENDEDVEIIKNNDMYEYFQMINLLDQRISDRSAEDYRIDSYTLMHKEIYSFSRWEIAQFINDYQVVDNASLAFYRG